MRAITQMVRLASAAAFALGCESAVTAPGGPDLKKGHSAGGSGGGSAGDGATYVELPAPSGESRAYGINNGGEIVGTVTGGCLRVPVLWTSSSTEPVSLPLPAGSCRGLARHINDNGIILGEVRPDAAVTATSVQWVPGPGGYVVSILPEPQDGDNVDVGDINSSGHGAGYALGPDDAYWWDGTMLVRLQEIATSRCFANAINGADAIAGRCITADSPTPLPWEAVFWSSPEATPVGLPGLNGAYRTNAVGLNNTGGAVGTATLQTGSSTAKVAVRWTLSGAGWSIDTLPNLGGVEAEPADVTNDGWVTGQAQTASGTLHAVAWTPGGAIRDLGSGKNTSYAYAIRAGSGGAHLVVGLAQGRSHTMRAAVWTVAP